MKTRIVYTHFWQDDNFAELSKEAKILFLYLISNDSIGLIPVYKISDRVTTYCTGIKKEDLPQYRQELEKVGMFYEEGYYIMDNEFAQYDYIGGKSKHAKIKEIDKLPKKIKELLIQKQQKEELLVNHWSMIDHINHKPEIINDKPETKDQKEGVGEKEEIKKSDIRILADPEVYGGLIEEFPDVDIVREFKQIRDWAKANGSNKKDWIAFARKWLRDTQDKQNKFKNK